jgi:hypothetical protein
MGATHVGEQAQRGLRHGQHRSLGANTEGAIDGEAAALEGKRMGKIGKIFIKGDAVVQLGRAPAQPMRRVAGSSPACCKPTVWRRTLNPLTAPISEKFLDIITNPKNFYMSEKKINLIKMEKTCII